MSTHRCTCPGPGDCPTWGRRMAPREHQLCQGGCPAESPCPEELRQMYLKSWAGGTNGAAPPTKPEPIECPFLGEPTGEFHDVVCKTCGGDKPKITHFKIYECRLESIGVTLLETKAPGHGCCRTCSVRKAIRESGDDK